MTPYHVLYLFTLCLSIHCAMSEESPGNTNGSTVDQVNVVNKTMVNETSNQSDADIYLSDSNWRSFQEINPPFSPLPRWFHVTLTLIYRSTWLYRPKSAKQDNSPEPVEDSPEPEDDSSEPNRPILFGKLINNVKQKFKKIGKAIGDLFKPDEDEQYNPHPPPPPRNVKIVE